MRRLFVAIAAYLAAAAAVPAGEGPGAPSGAGGVRVRVLQGLETSFVWTREGDAGSPGPMVLVGARQGSFSGRLEVSSPTPIRDLKVDVGDLAMTGGAGHIPAAQISVRYAEVVDEKKSFVQSVPYSKTNMGRFDALLEGPPAEVAVQNIPVPKGAILPASLAAPAPGAVQPVWITVRVNAEAAPGEYRGKLTVKASGLAATEIPLRLKVHDWKIPDPKDFTVHHNIYQSQESVAMYYQVPLWSDRHFQLMGKSLALIKDAGNKLCVLHLINEAFCMGNTQSMVRWVKQADGTYTHDYSVLDRYLDLYEKTSGKPGLVILSVWGRGADGDRTLSMGKEMDMPAYARRPRHKVMLLDPATGKVEPMEQPEYGTPESVAFWKPALAGVRARLEKRGWFEVTALGSGDDALPLPRTISGFKQIWPDGKWHSISHMNPAAYKASDGSSVPVTYSEHVWGAGRLYNPDAKGMYVNKEYPMPWSRGAARIEWGFPRTGINFIDFLYDSSPLAAWRCSTEASIQGNLNGIGRFGADFWPISRNKRGTYEDITRTEFNLGPRYSTLALLAPGPDGAIATERYEMFREGVQVAEAVICVRKAMASGKLSADLAKRCETHLDERARQYIGATLIRKQAGDVYDWKVMEAVGWQERDDRLYALASEVSKAMGGK